MTGIFNPKQMLKPTEDQTAPLGFEPAAKNVIKLNPNQCPQCLRPMGVKGYNSATVKVWTAHGVDFWCNECFQKGEQECTCMKYRNLSKKEQKFARKILKQNERIKNAQMS